MIFIYLLYVNPVSGWHFMLLKGPLFLCLNNMTHSSVKNWGSDKFASLMFFIFFVEGCIPSYFSTYQYLPLSIFLLERKNFDQPREKCFRIRFHYMIFKHISHEYQYYLILGGWYMLWLFNHNYVICISCQCIRTYL